MSTTAPVAGTSPRVSVVMTCYNEGPFIGAAVRSVTDQTRADLVDKIVIADDGSAPETIAVLRELEAADRRVEVLYGTGGNGISRQRNLAIARTSTPFVAILDGDDLWTPDKIETELPLIEADPQVGLVYSDFYLFADGDLSSAHLAKALDITGAADLAKAYFQVDPPIVPSTTILRRAVLDEVGGFDPSVKVFEDTDLFNRLARVCRFAFTPKPLLYKRVRRSSITGSNRDLMAQHAFVAFRAAAADPRLMPLVPARLAERASKLANSRFLTGDYEEAVALARLALRLDPLSLRSWLSRVATAPVMRPIVGRMASVAGRRKALGVQDPAGGGSGR
ncbi:glycosyltransferase [Prosthecomicrobium sp. N25]|uniref:glycosyltransferase n=1 Tax=Prosthecomicrobium sp. N25 TaxID=3129254 RepID=UPI003076B483